MCPVILSSVIVTQRLGRQDIGDRDLLRHSFCNHQTKVFNLFPGQILKSPCLQEIRLECTENNRLTLFAF